MMCYEKAADPHLKNKCREQAAGAKSSNPAACFSRNL